MDDGAADAGLTGWGLHVAALSQAPLSIVQAFSSGGLALVAPLAARVTRTPLRARERRAVVMMGIALLALGLGAGTSAAGAVPSVPMAIYLAICAFSAGLLALAPAGRRRAHALGAAAGILYGAGDAATKALTAEAHAGLTAALLSPWTAVVAVASVAAFFCFQRGLQIGPALPVIALMTAATNLTAIVCGVVVFGDPLGAGAAFVGLHVIALALVGLAAWWLAPAQARIEAHGQEASASAPLRPVLSAGASA